MQDRSIDKVPQALGLTQVGAQDQVLVELGGMAKTDCRILGEVARSCIGRHICHSLAERIMITLVFNWVL